MVGLNHSFGTQLLWNEYPTDQLGSYFRQFWDVKSEVSLAVNQGQDPDKVEETYKDILPINTWVRGLGDNGNKNPGKASVKENNLVLIIRGDLLKRYPNTIIYAVKAKRNVFPPDPDLNDPKSLPLHPIFSAFIDPDITFLGFNLVMNDVKDPNPNTMAGEHGYFFVLEEHIQEPKFGLEETNVPDPDPYSWTDLAWPDVKLKANNYIEPNTPSKFNPKSLKKGDKEWDPNYVDPAPWNPSKLNGESMAGILMRRPFRLCVHAEEMLPQ